MSADIRDQALGHYLRRIALHIITARDEHEIPTAIRDLTLTMAGLQIGFSLGLRAGCIDVAAARRVLAYFEHEVHGNDAAMRSQEERDAAALLEILSA